MRSFSNKRKVDPRYYEEIGDVAYEDGWWKAHVAVPVYIDGDEDGLSQDMIDKFAKMKLSLNEYSTKCIDWMNDNIAEGKWSLYQVIIDDDESDMLIQITDDKALEVHGFRCGHGDVVHAFSDD